MPVSLLRMMEQYDSVIAHHVHQLEEITGRNSEDIRLDQEIQAVIRQKIIDLGLDPADTTAKEFYHGLSARFLNDDAALLKTHTSSQKFLEAVQVQLKKDKIQAWTIKSAALKKIIKANPPKNLAAQLGYRTMDSMLKREKPGELLLAAEYVEPATWHTKLLAAFKKVKAADFGPSEVEFTISTDQRWQKVAEQLIQKQGNTVLVSWLTGSIFVINPPEVPGIQLANLMSIQRAIETIVVHGSLLRFVQVSKKFHVHFAELLADKVKVFALSQRIMAWSEITTILSEMDEDALQERFGLHIAPEDFRWPSLVSEIGTELLFWAGALEYAVFQEDIKKPFVSLNPLDIVANLLPEQKTYDKATATHGLAAMEQELLKRYARHDVLKEQLLLQLEHL